MLLGENLGGLITQQLKVLAQYPARQGWVDDVVHKSPPRRHLTTKRPNDMWGKVKEVTDADKIHVRGKNSDSARTGESGAGDTANGAELQRKLEALHAAVPLALVRDFHG